ncbi:MAG: glycine cleavage system aminomethyltransferase GcvT [Nitrososphaerales archaeon]
MPKKSHLYNYHKEHGKITEFSGFEMPLWYTSIIDEHTAVRNSAGLFDVSHMGRVSISGKGVSDYLDHLLPTNCSKIRNGRAFYSVICNESGGIIDDVITNKSSEFDYSMVINAGNREKDLAWLKRIAQNYEVSLEDYSDSSALIALQGPLASELLQEVADSKLSELKRFSFIQSLVDGERCQISRTGYTGEDGFEITIYDTPLNQPERALKIWTKLLALGSGKGVLPCGLGARDSLRLEAGMCLYGQDIDEKTTPIEASLESVVNLDERRFIGKEAIEAQIKNGVVRKRVAFSMLDAGIPRHGFDILFSGKSVGVVTSGTFSPVMKKGIGMAYVPSPISSIGQKLTVKIRDSERNSEVVPVPFYDTTKYGYKRAKT